MINTMAIKSDSIIATIIVAWLFSPTLVTFIKLSADSPAKSTSSCKFQFAPDATVIAFVVTAAVLLFIVFNVAPSSIVNVESVR